MKLNKRTWVKSNAGGVWQIKCQIKDHYVERFDLSSSKTLRESKLYWIARIVDEKWNPRFESAVVDETWLKPLNKTDTQKLEKLLAADRELLGQFQNFDQPVDSILNLGFSLPRRSGFAKFKKELTQLLKRSLESGMTNDAVLNVISESSFADFLGETPSDATLQLVCKGFEIKRRNLIYREVNFHNF